MIGIKVRTGNSLIKENAMSLLASIGSIVGIFDS